MSVATHTYTPNITITGLFSSQKLQLQTRADWQEMRNRPFHVTKNQNLSLKEKNGKNLKLILYSSPLLHP